MCFVQCVTYICTACAYLMCYLTMCYICMNVLHVCTYVPNGYLRKKNKFLFWEGGKQVSSSFELHTTKRVASVCPQLQVQRPIYWIVPRLLYTSFAESLESNVVSLCFENYAIRRNVFKIRRRQKGQHPCGHVGPRLKDAETTLKIGFKQPIYVELQWSRLYKTCNFKNYFAWVQFLTS
jgi:hypothetical protein